MIQSQNTRKKTLDVERIVFHHDTDPDENPWVHGAPPVKENIEVVPYDPTWTKMYKKLAHAIREVLGPVALQLEHVGSTAVPGLAAKPVIDIDLTVSDPTNEKSYVPALEKLGYDLTVRELKWHQHRCLRLASPRVNLHVFGPDCPEFARHRMFRDWLKNHPEDRNRYEKAKYEAIPGAGTVMEYNERKQNVIREIYEKIFKAAGYLP